MPFSASSITRNPSPLQQGHGDAEQADSSVAKTSQRNGAGMALQLDDRTTPGVSFRVCLGADHGDPIHLVTEDQLQCLQGKFLASPQELIESRERAPCGVHTHCIEYGRLADAVPPGKKSDPPEPSNGEILDSEETSDRQASQAQRIVRHAGTFAVARKRGARRWRVACSKAYAMRIRVGSLHARPKNETPTGRPWTKPAGTVTLG